MEGRSLPSVRIVNRTRKLQIKILEWEIKSTLLRFRTSWANENLCCKQYVLRELDIICNALKYHSFRLIFLTWGLTVENKYICEFTLNSMKLIVYADLATASAVIKNTWIYTSIPHYASLILCLMKHWDILASHFEDRNSGRLSTSCRHFSALQTPAVTSYSTGLKHPNIMLTTTQPIFCFVRMSEQTSIISLNNIGGIVL